MKTTKSPEKISNYKKTLKELMERYDISKFLTEADDEEPESDDQQEEAPEENGDDAAEPDATMPTEDDIEAMEDADDAQELPVDEDSIIISQQEQADIANTMLAALMAPAPQSGVIPEEFLTVTPQNANDLIKFIKNYVAIGPNSPEKDMGDIANNII